MNSFDTHEATFHKGTYLKYPYYKGQVIDDITILEDDFVIVGRRYLVKFQCRCGHIDYKRVSQIERMQYKSCKYCSKSRLSKNRHMLKSKFIKHINITWIRSIKNGLNRRAKDLECTLTEKDLYDKLLEQDNKCVFTGITLNVLDINKEYSNASIDRIDSDKGYTKDNIQWVYKPINKIKGPLKDEEFIYLCSLVSNARTIPKDFLLKEFYWSNQKCKENPLETYEELFPAD